MLKVVYDTNVLISAFIAESYPREAFRMVLGGKVMLLASEELLAEFESVLSREKFGFTKLQINDMILMVKRASKIVAPQQKLNIIKQDPDDNVILECAIEGKAGYIVSGDRHLLALKQYRGIKIITARQFIETLKS